MAKPRLLLADDHELVLAAFTKLLEAKFEVAGTVTDGLALLKRACELKPDVIVLDLGMPRLNGMDAGKELKKNFLPPRSLF
jgi:DNA-binding NarL/FixJ family response regulator